MWVREGHDLTCTYASFGYFCFTCCAYTVLKNQRYTVFPAKFNFFDQKLCLETETDIRQFSAPFWTYAGLRNWRFFTFSSGDCTWSLHADWPQKREGRPKHDRDCCYFLVSYSFIKADVHKKYTVAHQWSTDVCVWWLVRTSYQSWYFAVTFSSSLLCFVCDKDPLTEQHVHHLHVLRYLCVCFA